MTLGDLTSKTLIWIGKNMSLSDVQLTPLLVLCGCVVGTLGLCLLIDRIQKRVQKKREKISEDLKK